MADKINVKSVHKTNANSANNAFEILNDYEISATAIDDTNSKSLGMPNDTHYQYGVLITFRAILSTWQSFQMYIPDLYSSSSTAVYIRNGYTRRWLKLTGEFVDKVE